MPTDHAFQYWYVQVFNDNTDEVVHPYGWVVATGKDQGPEEAIQQIVQNGMLPTDLTNETDREVDSGESVKLNKPYILDAEIIEWEGDQTVARLF